MGKDKTSQGLVQSEFLKVREAFKAWEYLAENLDPVFVKDHINGAPLPKLERDAFGLLVLEPKGMQVLDEAVFAATPYEGKAVMLKHIDQLADNLTQFNNPGVLYDRNIFEAARIELVRLNNLGLTGFDVPGSANAVPDAITVLETLKEDIAFYHSAIETKSPQVAARIEKLFRGSIGYLKLHSDFNKLDRLYFLKQFINPLYSDLLVAQRLLGIEMMREAMNLLPPYNYESENLFANDFLDPFRYLTLPQAIYSDSLVHLGRTLFFDPVLSVNR